MHHRWWCIEGSDASKAVMHRRCWCTAVGDEPQVVMHRRWWCTAGADALQVLMHWRWLNFTSRCFSSSFFSWFFIIFIVFIVSNCFSFFAWFFKVFLIFLWFSCFLKCFFLGFSWFFFLGQSIVGPVGGSVGLVDFIGCWLIKVQL